MTARTFTAVFADGAHARKTSPKDIKFAWRVVPEIGPCAQGFAKSFFMAKDAAMLYRRAVRAKGVKADTFFARTQARGGEVL